MSYFVVKFHNAYVMNYIGSKIITISLNLSDARSFKEFAAAESFARLLSDNGYAVHVGTVKIEEKDAITS